MSAIVRTAGRAIAAVYGPAVTEPTARTMAAAIGVNGLGTGLFLPLSALYFTRVMGLGTAGVAAGLGIAAFASIFAGLPLGLVADRVGAKPTLVTLLVLTGVTMSAYLLADNLWEFTLVATTVRMLDRGISSVAAALVANVIPDPRMRTQVRASQRAVLASGLAVGSGLSTIALSASSPAAYTLSIAADALTFVLAGLIYLRLPGTSDLRRSEPVSPWSALTDVPFLWITVAFSVLGVSASAVTFALPIWAVEHTTVPAAVISVAFIVSTITNLLLQVPIARRVGSLRHAKRAAVAGAALLALACLLFAGAGRVGAAGGAVLILAAVLTNILGGMWATAAQFFIFNALPPESAQGQYQGLVTTGTAVSAVLAPGLLAALPLAHPGFGWMVVAALFVSAGAVITMFVTVVAGQASRQAEGSVIGGA